MSLLQEIQNDAVDAKTDLPTLLRKCRILAARLKNDDFKKWVQYELDGYPLDSHIPDYRKVRCQSYGHFFGPFGSAIKNAPLPTMSIPKEHREFVSTVIFHDGVGALQNLISHNDGRSIQEEWPADLVAFVASRFYKNMNLAQAWKSISSSTIISILDTVRNRILNFVLEIESAAPNAGEGTMTPTLTAEKVTNVFNTYIMGNVGNVASGGSNINQEAIITIRQGDWNALEKYLKSIGLDDTDLRDLMDAVKEEPKATATGFGNRVALWVGKMVSKSAQGIWNVTTTVASNILTKALAQYYGLPNL